MPGLTLPFGCNRALPESVRVAWGARLIAPDDLLQSRQGCAGGEENGPERAALLAWLNSGVGEAFRAAIREQYGYGDWDGRSHGGWDGSSQEVRELYRDDRGVVWGSPQGSHGYVYVAAWLFEHEGAAAAAA